MKIDAVSDLHGFYPKLAGGDLLIVAGDLTATDEEYEYKKFFGWLRDQKYEETIVIAGNHDNYLQNHIHIEDLEDSGEFTYLCESGTEFEYEEIIEEEHKFKGMISYKVKRKLKIFGSPWTKTFKGMNPKCKAFTCDTEEELAEKFSLIPADIDILITHSPPYGILDGIPLEYDGTEYHAGSTSLRNMVLDGNHFTNLKHHIFGHIHEQGGRSIDLVSTQFHNCSYVNERYKPVNKPIRIEL